MANKTIGSPTGQQEERSIQSGAEQEQDRCISAGTTIVGLGGGELPQKLCKGTS